MEGVLWCAALVAVLLGLGGLVKATQCPGGAPKRKQVRSSHGG